jgi:transcription termination/antitermination protein NusA
VGDFLFNSQLKYYYMSLDITDLKQHIELICIERGLDVNEVVKAIEIAISAAYRKEFGERDHAYEANFDVETGKYNIFRTWAVVEEPQPTEENPEPMIQEGKELLLVQARLNDPSAELGTVIKQEMSLENSVEFGRIASQVAKQVLFQTINNVRHTKILQQFVDKIGDVVTVEIDCFRKGGYLVKLGQTTGYINRENLLPVDKFKPGQLIRALIVDISEDERGNSRVTLSRTHNDFVRAIIAKEVPEVNSGMVIIEKIVREPGSRTKILVSADENETVDPVGSILGRKNVRLINIMREITTSLQEKIDVIEQRDDIEGMIMDSLEPAEIDHVVWNAEKRHADVFCYPEEASLAVGKRGVNIRLASDLLDAELNIETLEEEDITETKLGGDDEDSVSMDNDVLDSEDNLNIDID